MIHTDADEFWWPLHGTLAEALAAIPERYGVVVAPRTEFVGRPDGAGSFAERLTVRESRARLQPKVAHRADPDVVVLDRGGHDVAVAGPGGDAAETLRPPGRPVHRTIRDPRGATPRARRTRPGSCGRPAGRCESSTSRCGRPHSSSAVPRSRSSRAGSRTGGASGVCASSSRRAAWRSCTPSCLWDDAALEAGIRDGQLVRDDRLARLLPKCPDPTQRARRRGASGSKPNPTSSSERRPSSSSMPCTSSAGPNAG